MVCHNHLLARELYRSEVQPRPCRPAPRPLFRHYPCVALQQAALERPACHGVVRRSGEARNPPFVLHRRQEERISQNLARGHSGTGFPKRHRGRCYALNFLKVVLLSYYRAYVKFIKTCQFCLKFINRPYV